MRIGILALAPVILGLTTLSCLAQDAATEAPPAPPLLGRIEGNSYIAPTGSYRVDLPVLPELGGTVTDTENVVTFQDAFNVHASIACFQMDASMRWENETRGRQEYLVWFFSNFVQGDFAQKFPGAKIESAVFIPSLHGGALLVYNLLPGGTMFGAHIILGSEEKAPTAKRGNLLFVRGEYVYILSIELAEKVLERSSYKLTVQEENSTLRKRLMDFLDKIHFTAPAAPTPTPPAVGAAPKPTPAS